jgi:hypothetical protein
VLDSALTRITAFKCAFARRQAQHIVDVDGGFAVLNAKFAASYDHNKVIFATIADPERALAEADRVLGDANLDHRQVAVNDDQSALAAAASFTEAGYDHGTSVFMRHTGAAPDHPADPALKVESVPWQALGDIDTRIWRELPGARAGGHAAGRAASLRCSAPMRSGSSPCVTTPATSSPMPAVHRPGTASRIEEVTTLTARRGRGCRALMAEGLERATAARCDLLFWRPTPRTGPIPHPTRLRHGRTRAFTRSARVTESVRSAVRRI